VAGALYGLGSKLGFAPLPWWASAGVAVLGAAQIPLIERVKSKEAVVRSAAAWRDEEVGDGGREERSSRREMVLVEDGAEVMERV